MPKRPGAVLERPASTPGHQVIVDSAMDLLDEVGFSGCTLPALADRLNVDPAALAEHYPSRDALLTDMAKAMVARADAEREPAALVDAADGWRELLWRRAQALRSAMRSRRDGALLLAWLPVPTPIAGSGVDSVKSLCDAGFTLSDARAAVQLVDRFALGWAVAEQARLPAETGDGTLPGYDDQLATLLSGLAATRAWGSAANGHHMFQPRLWVFLRNVRDSANIAFSRAGDVNELDRRILLLVRAQGDLTLAEVTAGLGVDKAQISRSIKRLTEVGLVKRAGIRSPLRLSLSGRQLTDQLTRLANLRNSELGFGISDTQLVDLFAVLDVLLERALTLYEQERKASADLQKQEGDIDFPDIIDQGERDAGGRIPVDRSRILPPFITLCAYMMRGAALAYKRKTGLSNFDSWVLSEVCHRPPISWPQLVLALYRDQSQAGRTVNRLIDLGLIERTGKPGRRHGFFSPTEEGRRISDIINDLTARRSEFLFQGIAATQLTHFTTAFDLLSRNAEVQLAREKAIQEMDRNEVAEAVGAWINPASV